MNDRGSSTAGRSRLQRTSCELAYMPKDPFRTIYTFSSFDFELPLKYEGRRFLGKGCHMPVCLASNTQTNKPVAIMKMFNTLHDLPSARKTLFFLKMLPLRNHKNIVGFIEIIPPIMREYFKGEIYIVYDKMYCDLQYAIYREGLSISTVKDVLYQILCGLKYLHSGYLSVKILNLNNVHLNRIDTIHWEVKLADYEMAHLNPQTNLLTDYVEPTRYQAPEVLQKSQHTGSAADIWSVGCILMELLTRAPLFRGENAKRNFGYILKLLGSPKEDELWFLADGIKNLIRSLPSFAPQSFINKFPDVDILAIDLVVKMIVFDPNKRITAADALKHPYFAPDEPVGTPFNSYINLRAFGYRELQNMIFQELTSYDI